MTVRVLLDTKDLIDLFEGSDVSKILQFERTLRDSDAVLVLTSSQVSELAPPLLRPERAPTRRRRLETLSILEILRPKIYMDFLAVWPLELIEADAALRGPREPHRIDPRIPRLDYGFNPGGDSPTRMLLEYPLHELAQHWAPGIAETKRKWNKLFPEGIRSLRDNPRRSPRDRFRTCLADLVVRIGIKEVIRTPIEDLADWILEEPTRCPGTMLCYDTRSSLVSNKGDRSKGSDLGDLNLILLAPYVDFMTADRRMRDYLLRVTKDFPGVASVMANVDEVLATLQKHPSPPRNA